jgi:hypothetical protein
MHTSSVRLGKRSVCPRFPGNATYEARRHPCLVLCREDPNEPPAFENFIQPYNSFFVISLASPGGGC